MIKLRKRYAGYTLVELLVTVAIIGIMSAVVFSSNSSGLSIRSDAEVLAGKYLAAYRDMISGRSYGDIVRASKLEFTFRAGQPPEGKAYGNDKDNQPTSTSMVMPEMTATVAELIINGALPVAPGNSATVAISGVYPYGKVSFSTDDPAQVATVISSLGIKLSGNSSVSKTLTINSNGTTEIH